MPRGPHTRALTDHQRNRLEKFRRASHDGAPHGYSVALLRTAMGARFSPETLQKALQGRPVLDLYHAYIVEWIDRFLPPAPRVHDGKMAVAGRDNGGEDSAPEGNPRGRSADQEAGGNGESDETKAGATRTVRGSR